MKQHIARPILWCHGTASRELMWFLRNIDKIPHTADMMVDVELGNRDQGVAPGIVLGHQAKRGGPDSPMVPHPTHHCQGTPVQGNSFPQARTPHPSSPRL